MLFPVGRSYARAFAIITCKKIPCGTVSRKFPAKKFIAARKLYLKNILFLKAEKYFDARLSAKAIEMRPKRNYKISYRSKLKK